MVFKYGVFKRLLSVDDDDKQMWVVTGELRK